MIEYEEDLKFLFMIYLAENYDSNEIVNFITLFLL